MRASSSNSQNNFCEISVPLLGWLTSGCCTPSPWQPAMTARITKQRSARPKTVAMGYHFHILLGDEFF